MPIATVSWDLVALARWARGIARGVRCDFERFDCRFAEHSSYEEDLESFAVVEALRRRERFDEARVPGDWRRGAQDYFCVTAAQHIRKEVRREAQRLRNGGISPTTGRGAAKAAVGLPVTCGEGRQEVALAAAVVTVESEGDDGADEGSADVRVVFCRHTQPALDSTGGAANWKRFLAGRRTTATP